MANFTENALPAVAPVVNDFDDDCAEEPSEGCRARHWVFTKHNPDEEHEFIVYGMGPDNGAIYVVCEPEVCPTTNTPHLQGAVSWKTLKSWQQMRDLLPDAYWRPKVARSTFKQWSEYCKKDANGGHYEYGQLPADPIDKAECGKRHWQEQLDLCEAKKFREMHPQVLATQLRSVLFAVKTCTENEQPPAVALLSTAKTPNEWHWGVSGSGKTGHCKALAPYEKEIGDPDWSDYTSGNIVLDELTDVQMRKHMSLIKKMGHEYTFKIKRHYVGAIAIRPPCVFITSQTDPANVYTGQDLVAIKRRYRMVHWPEPYWVDANEALGRNPKWFDPTK